MNMENDNYEPNEEIPYYTQKDVLSYIYTLEYSQSGMTERDFETLNSIVDAALNVTNNNMKPVEVALKALAYNDRFRNFYGEKVYSAILDLANAIRLFEQKAFSGYIFRRIGMGCKYAFAECRAEMVDA